MKRLLCTAAGTLTLVATWCALPATTSAADELARRQQELRDVQTRISDLQKDIDKKRGMYRRLLQAVQTSEQAGTKTVAEIKKTKAALEGKIKGTNTLDRRIADLAEELAADRKLLGSLVRAAYLGSSDWPRFLLNRRDVARTGRMLAYYNYFNNLRLRRISDITTSLQELTAMQQTMTLDLKRLRDLETRYRQLLDQYLKQREQREEAVGELHVRLSEDGLALSLLKEQAASLRKLVTMLERKTRPARAGQARFQALKGKLRWPVAGHPENRFGGPRQDGLLTWDGVNLTVPAGEPVRAVSDGRVVYSDWFHNLGLLVILDHGEGYMSLYGHNEQLESRKGRRVRAGEVIAYAGDSGGRSESAVYFEIRHNGVPLDPARWCLEAPDV